MSKLSTFPRLLLAVLALALPAAAVADRDKDERGHGKHRHARGEYKEAYWDGHCKVKRKFDKHGGYKEERKCKGHGPAVAYAPQPVYVPAPAPVVVEPGIVIHGTVRVQ